MIDGRHVVCGLALALSMCGGAAPERPAASPSHANEPQAAPPSSLTSAPAAAAPAPYPQQETPAMEAAPAPASAPPPPPRAPAPPPPRDLQRAAAREELDRSERTLQASLGDCSAACRALDSMDRAVTHLCALVDGPSDQRRCDDARQRLSVARRRIRETCGACTN